MIKSVKVTNLARWKWTHEINYYEWINIIDGKFGVWKSSLLVDAFEIAIKGEGRDKIDELVTKWEDFLEVEVIFTDKFWQEYKLFFHHTKKTKVLNKKWEEKIKAWKTVQEVYRKLDDWEYEKITITPEEILGIPYETASKTFIIKQNDIEAFATSSPSEKYEIIAKSFQIEELFIIGERAKQKKNNLIIEKESLITSSWDIDYSQIENIPTLEKDLSQSETKKNKKLSDRKKLSDFRISISEKKWKFQLLDNLNQEINSQSNTLSFIESSSYKQDLDLLNKLRDEIKLLDDSKVLELREKVNNKRWVIQMTQTNYKIRISDLDKWYGNELLRRKKELETLIIEGKKFKESISHWTEDLYTYYSWLSESQKQEIFDTYTVKKIDENNLKLTYSVKEQEIDRLLKLREDIKKLEKGTCPMCRSNITHEHKTSVITTLNDEIHNVLMERETLRNNIEKTEEEVKSLETHLFYIDNINQYKELLTKRESVLSLQKELEQVQKEYDEKRKELETSYREEVSKTNSELEILEKELDELEKNNLKPQLELQIHNLQEKTFTIDYRLYKLEQLPNLYEFTQSNKNENEKKLESLLKEVTWTKEELETEFQRLQKEIEVLDNDLEELTTEINIRSWEIKVLKDKKEQYLKNKKRIEVLNTEITRYEKLEQIFGKKWQPKVIIETIIIPNLQNRTNEILREISDGRYEVEFVLESFTATGQESKKNTFNINVCQYWSTQSYNTLSGGEKMTINYALRLGITQCLNELLGFKTSDFLVLDEVFNSIDWETSEEQIVKNIKKTSNKYKQIFIITHVPELKEWLINESTVYRVIKDNQYSRLE